MFQNLQQVQAWLQNGGIAIPHTLVDGETEWISEEVVHLQQLIIHDDRSERLYELNVSRAERAHRTALAEHARKVRDRRNGDEVSTRLRKQIADLHSAVEAKGTWIDDTLEEVRMLEKGSAARKRASKGLPEAQKELPNLKGQLQATQRELDEYLALEAPAKPQVAPPVKVAPTDAPETIERYQAFLAAATDTPTAVTQQVTELHDLLVEHARIARDVKSQLTSLASTLGVDPEKLRPLLDSQLDSETRDALQTILNDGERYYPAFA